jgi:hypothetical protein
MLITYCQKLTGYAILGVSKVGLVTSGKQRSEARAIPTHSVGRRKEFLHGYSTGVWRSRLARSVRDAEVGGSSPLTPTRNLSQRDQNYRHKQDTKNAGVSDDPNHICELSDTFEYHLATRPRRPGDERRNSCDACLTWTCKVPLLSLPTQSSQAAVEAEKAGQFFSHMPLQPSSSLSARVIGSDREERK